MSQIIKKFIGNNQVDGTKIRLENNQTIRARNQANTADIELLKLNAADALEFSILPVYSGSSLATESFVTTQLGNYVETSLLGANNGVATLDAGGKVPASQLPSTVMEFQGTFDPTVPSPNLANGVGDAGDVYIVSAAGSHDFGAGAISFGAGDWVIYNGTIWERSANSNLANSIDGSHIRLANNQSLRARNAADDADVNLFKLNASNQLVLEQNLLPDSASREIGSSTAAFQRIYVDQVSSEINGDLGLGADGWVSIFSGGDVVEFLGTSAGITLQFYDAAQTNYAAIKAPDSEITSSYTLTLPVADGTAGQMLSTDGAGQLEWADIALAADSVDGSLIRLDNDQYLRGRNSTDDGDVNIIKVNAADSLTIGATILPETTTQDLGASGDRFRSIYLSSAIDIGGSSPYFYMEDTDGSGNHWLNFYVGTAPVSQGLQNTSASSMEFGNLDGGTSIMTYQGGTMEIASTNIGGGTHVGGVFLTVRDNATPNGNTGDISLFIGTPGSGGTQGGFRFLKQNVASAIGQVWTATDVDGSGYWADAPVSVPTFAKETITLSAGDITNQYVDLNAEAVADSVILVVGGVVQAEGVDYNTSVEGGVTRISFVGDLATSGASELVASDVLYVMYVEA